MTSGCPRQLLRANREVADSTRHGPPQPLQLCAGAVMTHTDVVDNALHLLLPMSQSVLPAAALVDLVVTVTAAGEWLPVRCTRFQIGCLPDPVPQAIRRPRPDLLSNCPRIELGVQHVLQIIQVVLTVAVVAEQVPHERDLRLVAVHLPRPVQDISVLPLGTGIINPQAVVVIPWYEVEVRRTDEIVRLSPMPRVVEIIIRPGRIIVVPAP